MKSILQLIRELEYREWDYYQDIDIDRLGNPFFGEISYTHFIHRFFERGGKNDLLRDESIHIPLSNLRYPNHICSVFFLGIILSQHTNILPKSLFGKSKVGYEVFPFLWFLTALFHDHAYQLEEDPDNLVSVSDLPALKKILKLEHDLSTAKVTKIPDQLLSAIEQYFIYRRKEWDKIDHGILAGFYMYDALVKIRRKKFADGNRLHFWGKRLEKHYALAAGPIAVHNIWMPTDETLNTYKTFSLDSLLNFEPIRFRKAPLLYLLGIVDTIDPIKTFVTEAISDTYVYSNVFLEFRKTALTIQVQKDSSLKYAIIEKKANGLKGWLDVKIDSNPNLQNLTIRFF